MKKQNNKNNKSKQNLKHIMFCKTPRRPMTTEKERKKEARNTTTTFSFICDLTYFFQYVSYVMIICKMSNLLKFLKMI